MLLVKAAARGLATWVSYAIVGTLFSWACLAVSFSAIWRGSDGIGHAAHAGAAVLILLLFMPQFWATMLYLVGIPAVSVVLGQGMGIRAALQRALREKSGMLSEAALRAVWPVCQKLAAQSGTNKLHDAARAIDQAIQNSTRGALRWLLRRVSNIAKLPALLAGGEFLERVRSQPDAAQSVVRTRIEDELRQRTQGSVFRTLWILLGVTALITVLILFAWPFGSA